MLYLEGVQTDADSKMGLMNAKICRIAIWTVFAISFCFILREMLNSTYLSSHHSISASLMVAKMFNTGWNNPNESNEMMRNSSTTDKMKKGQTATEVLSYIANVTQKTSQRWPTEVDNSKKVLDDERKHLLHSMYSCKDGSECWKLNKLLMENWNSLMPKAAVCILTSVKDREVLKETLRLLYENFLSIFKYPVIIFHESGFKFKDDFRKLLKIDLFFQEVELHSVDFLHPPIPIKSSCPYSNNIKYRNMCRFQAKTIFELPIMKNLNYYMRLDAHSYIEAPIKMDIFAYMRSNKIQYGFPCVVNDDPMCIKDLCSSAEFYIKSKQLTPHFYEKMNNTAFYFNNFQVGNLNFFRGPSYQNFIRYIDSLGGIYYYRWGDAPIVSIAVSIFIPENATRQFYDISYKHRNEVLTKNEPYVGPRDWKCPPF